MLLKVFVSACVALLLTAYGQDQKQPLRKFELKAESEDFWKLIDRGAKLEKFVGGFGFSEGPVWDDRGFLYVTDEIQSEMFRVLAHPLRSWRSSGTGRSVWGNAQRHGDCLPLDAVQPMTDLHDGTSAPPLDAHNRAQ